MRTHKGLLAFVDACFVQAILTASIASSRARMATFQVGATFRSTVWLSFGVPGNVAWYFLHMSTFQLHFNFCLALRGAGLSTSCLAGMVAWEGSFGKALDRQMFQDSGGKAPSGCAGMTELSCLGVPGIQGIFRNSDVYICGPAHTAPSGRPWCTCISCDPHRMGGTYGADMATFQAKLAGLIATTLRCTFEVITAGCEDLFIRMVSDNSASKHDQLDLSLSECEGCCSTA